MIPPIFIFASSHSVNICVNAETFFGGMRAHERETSFFFSCVDMYVSACICVRAFGSLEHSRPLQELHCYLFNRGSTFALRRSTRDLCLGEQRSLRAQHRRWVNTPCDQAPPSSSQMVSPNRLRQRSRWRAWAQHIVSPNRSR